MAKTTGVAWTELKVDNSSGIAVDIRNDVTNFSFAVPRGVQDITGIDKSAMERQLLLADFSIDLNGVFNTATSHTVFSTVSSSSVARSTTMEVDSAELDNECIYTDYALTRANTGELTWTSPGVLSDGTVPTWA